MNWGSYGILIAFGVFILLMIVNPRLSCFGKKMRSPFYPLLRKREKKAPPQTQDYGFHLVDGEQQKGPKAETAKTKAAKKTDDYGFRLD
jgi:hypothetical protein